MHLFCFGTLMDPDIRRLVLGRDLPDAIPAVLPGFRRVCVAEETYPAALPDPAGRIEGLLIGPISPHERDRVQFFEGFEFAIEGHPVAAAGWAGAALVCVATERLACEEEPWHFDDWRRVHKPGYLEAVTAYMAEFERLGIEDAHAVWLENRVTGR